IVYEGIMDCKGKKRTSNLGVPVAVEVVPPKSQRKTTAHKKKSLVEPIDLEVSDNEFQEQVPPPAVPDTNAHSLEATSAIASSSKAIEILSVAVGEAGPEFCQTYGVACWCKLETLFPFDWDFLNLRTPKEMLSRSLDCHFM
uniref:Uncharacterized protein n=1 Tax=Cannabis sativa TaxID=3483 RepID=A0A803QNI4_CANSA